MTTKQAWLEAGLTLLTREGIAAVRIDRLVGILGLSKGSFYHHFAGISGFRLDLLDHYERRFTQEHIDAAERVAELPASERLDRLRASVLSWHGDGAALDTAMRAWASQDDDARAMQERVDATRLGYLRSLWLEITGDPQEADLVSRMLYLLLIGGYHVMPPLPTLELDRVWDRVAGPSGVPRGRESAGR